MAAHLIKAGELVIVPTDTIYGIATLPDLPLTIHRLYEVRNRKPEPALPLLIANVNQLKKQAKPDKAARQLAGRFWPGPLTLILPPATQGVPVAVRVPNFPLLLPLFRLVGGCLFVSGAIVSGQSPAITAQEAAAFFGDHVALILDGGTSLYGLPSTILDCTTRPPLLVRHGAIPEEKIRDVLHNSVNTTRFQRR